MRDSYASSGASREELLEQKPDDDDISRRAIDGPHVQSQTEASSQRPRTGYFAGVRTMQWLYVSKLMSSKNTSQLVMLHRH
jgi:hypothetical protein